MVGPTVANVGHLQDYQPLSRLLSRISLRVMALGRVC
jgi:hypothetical protein